MTVDNKTGLSPPPPSNGSHQNFRDEINWDVISVEIGFALALQLRLGHLRSARDGVNGITNQCITSSLRYSLNLKRNLVIIEDMSTSIKGGDAE